MSGGAQNRAVPRSQGRTVDIRCEGVSEAVRVGQLDAGGAAMITEHRA
jgi:hypothetical protein